MRTQSTRLLNRQDTAQLLSLEECIAAVEQAFNGHGEGRALTPGILSIYSGGGGFHIKADLLEISGKKFFVAKTNGNFFQNTERFGLPNIVGTIVLCDGENGLPLAVMDSIEITIQRTGRQPPLRRNISLVENPRSPSFADAGTRVGFNSAPFQKYGLSKRPSPMIRTKAQQISIRLTCRESWGLK